MSRTIIEPPGRFNMPNWREVWAAREIFWRFGQKDILLRYRQTAVGVAWVFVQPLVAAGVFTIVFGGIAQLPSGGVPYFIFAFAGQMAWSLFNNIVNRASTSLVANLALVQKVFFPRIIVPLSVLIPILLDFAVSFGLFVVLLFVFGINPGWPILLLPVWVVMTVLLGLGLGLAASSWMVKYRDVQYFLPWFMQILMYASPIAYSMEAVDESGLEWLFNLNPITWLMEAYRWSLLGQSAPQLWQVLALAVAALVSITLGVLSFQRNERLFADVI
ncbi:ABC transporter permease [Microbacterium sulfonylureivorans]|uniref:ABC transporter permease n=1 Tax=Microbacterium sulfonylureivorans TaxID=2486854 RepID=UPI0013E047F8|nr:ABC transporter permease [Microbacterium sulfonylureivorans]